MSNKKTSFILKTEYKEKIQLLSQEQKGHLLDMIFEYHISDSFGDLPQKIIQNYDQQYFALLNMAFSAAMKTDFDENKIKWKKKREASIKAGKKGGRKSAEKQLLEY
jgi:hypothetical protein